jgi:hypothetical protein
MITRPTVMCSGIRGERSLFMSKENGKELFRNVNVILDAITNLNVRNLEVEAVEIEGRTSSTQPNLQKEKIRLTILTGSTFHSIQSPLLQDLSSRPRISQVVGSSFETPIVSPIPIAVASSSLADRPVIGAAAAARMVMNSPDGGGAVEGGDGGPPGGGPPGGGGPFSGGGDGPPSDGGPPGGGGGGGAPPPPLPYQTAAQFLAMWDNTRTDVGRRNLKQIAISRSTLLKLQLATMVKYNLRLQTTIATITRQVAGATVAAAMASEYQRSQRPGRGAGSRECGSFLSCCASQVREKDKGRGREAVDPRDRGLLANRPRCGSYPEPWHLSIWRVVLGPCGPICTRHIYRQPTAVPSPLTLVCSSGRP